MTFHCNRSLQGELALKNEQLAVAACEAEVLLKGISESTALAEKEKLKVAVIVEAVTKKVLVLLLVPVSPLLLVTPSLNQLNSGSFYAALSVCPSPLLQADEIAAVKEDAEKDLSEAKPALDAALAALNSIAPKDITGLKALKNPPDIVKRIFDCVLLLRCCPPILGLAIPKQFKVSHIPCHAD